MSTTATPISGLLDAIDQYLQVLVAQATAAQPALARALPALLKDLETQGDRIAATQRNQSLTLTIASSLKTSLRGTSYNQGLGQHLASYATLRQMMDVYLASLSAVPPSTQQLDNIYDKHIQQATRRLSLDTLIQQSIPKISDLILKAIKTQDSYHDLQQTLYRLIIGEGKVRGVLAGYVDDTAANNLHEFVSAYLHTAAHNQGIKTYRYVGPVDDKTRNFCRALVAREYIHADELPSIVHGDFAEYQELDGKIDAKTGLPTGLTKDTTAANFAVKRGGYHCRHQLVPVSEMEGKFEITGNENLKKVYIKPITLKLNEPTTQILSRDAIKGVANPVDAQIQVFDSKQWQYLKRYDFDSKAYQGVKINSSNTINQARYYRAILEDRSTRDIFEFQVVNYNKKKLWNYELLTYYFYYDHIDKEWLRLPALTDNHQSGEEKLADIIEQTFVFLLEVAFGEMASTISTGIRYVEAKLVQQLQNIEHTQELVKAGYKPFTRSYYRQNLKILTGIEPKGHQAHHVFPQQKDIAEFIRKRGINIHDPRYLTWWETISHQQNAKKYNAAWFEYIKKNEHATKEQILNFGRQLMKDEGINVNY
jgi:Predicted lipoprotein of unknown function (DUF2380)